MPNDLLKLLVVAAVAFVAYNVLLKDGGFSLIKNDGTVSVDAEASAEADSGQPSNMMDGVQGLDTGTDKHTVHGQVDDVYQNNPNVLPRPQISNNSAPQGSFEPNGANNFAQLDCFPKDQVQPGELLPPEGGFAESNPATQGQLINRNLFESGHHAGLNTQSSTMKNANLQLRSDPLIPRRDVGPWHQSTFEADTNRRPFEIGTA